VKRGPILANQPLTSEEKGSQVKLQKVDFTSVRRALISRKLTSVLEIALPSRLTASGVLNSA
jgi:hypothetical protein